MHNLSDWISGTVMGGCVGRSRMDGQGSARGSTRSKKRGEGFKQEKVVAFLRNWGSVTTARRAPNLSRLFEMN
ncbi:hypothetical protein ILYODFUR_008931 [Ilyodon furcidens]|uniref:Uncharacterized protein n=1 Tax=Ilyodon furcidens TaxID=33524 RepID=A0ABV0UFZ8_9TELE